MISIKPATIINRSYRSSRDAERSFTEFMAALSRGASIGLKQGVRASAEQARDAVSTAYKTGQVSGASRAALALHTIRKRQIGKMVGITAAIPPFPSRRALFRSGTLADNIESTRLGRTRYAVHVRRGILTKQTGGTPLPLDIVALKQEVGYTTAPILTRFSLAYLLVLYGRIMASGRGNPPDIKPRRMVIRVPGRPVWGPVFVSGHRTFFAGFLTRFQPNVQRYLRNAGFRT